MKQIQFPRIKPSLHLISRESGEIYCGTSDEGFLLDALPYLPLLRTCTGRTSIDEICRLTRQGRQEVLRHVGHLIELGLVENLESAPASASSYADQKMYLAKAQEEIETSLITHRSHDGGHFEWSARANFSILITGDTRIARTLLPLLSASGFTQTTIDGDTYSPSHIEAKDINSLTVTTEEIGKSKELHHRDLIRRSKVGSSQGLRAVRPHLVIATAPPYAEQIQRWQSEGIAHITLENSKAALIEITPIIIPGVTPCLRCITLHRSDALPSELRPILFHRGATESSATESSATESSATGQRRMELPVASAALIASLLASRAINFAFQSLGNSSLLGSDLQADSLATPASNNSHVINLLEPMTPILERKWNFHPECGCVDVQRRAWPR